MPAESWPVPCMVREGWLAYLAALRRFEGALTPKYHKSSITNFTSQLLDLT